MLNICMVWTLLRLRFWTLLRLRFCIGKMVVFIYGVHLVPPPPLNSVCTLWIHSYGKMDNDKHCLFSMFSKVCINYDICFINFFQYSHYLSLQNMSMLREMAEKKKLNDTKAKAVSFYRNDYITVVFFSIFCVYFVYPERIIK